MEGKQLQLDALFVRCLHITHVCPRHMCAVVEDGWKGRDGKVHMCVCERRALLLFRAIRYPSAGPWLMLHFFNKL